MTGPASAAAGDGAAGGRPAWMAHLTERLEGLPDTWFSRFLPPEGGGARESAVLILFGPGLGGGTELVLTERAHTMRSHAGQASFPGGGREAGDADLVGTALREAQEEVGLDVGGVDVVTVLPTVHIPVSGYDVTPVLAWWARPAPVWARDPREVERVVQIPVEHLVDPTNRFRVRHVSGFVGPAFDADGLLVWGFTAGLLDRTLRLAGLDRPWDASVVRDLP
ncbi:MAG: CoA pyrophosphatase [Actinomycetota bacterium]|nr:CoA pyrophosphatase [Actinomycetota bacterium]MDQ3526715.1 CoA pyrophosphatase [Actinomycetota bacterium]